MRAVERADALWDGASLDPVDVVVVTTPNASWMPEFPVATPGQIITRTDGRWGPQEYSLWPQLFSRDVSHHACIPVEEANLNGGAGSGYILEGQVEGEARTSAMSVQRSSK